MIEFIFDIDFLANTEWNRLIVSEINLDVPTDLSERSSLV